MAKFKTPEIIYGRGSAAALRNIKGERMSLITDRADVGELTDLLSGSFEIKPILVNQTTDPRCILDGTKTLMEFKPDIMLAIGGFGALDSAKLMRILYENPRLSLGELPETITDDITLKKTLFIAVPLINTNGSEMTSSASVRLPSGEVSIRCPDNIPSYTIIDPELLKYSDEREEAVSIIAAMTLSIQAMYHNMDNSFVMPYVVEALRLIARCAPIYHSMPAQKEKLLYAQCLSGIAAENGAAGACGAIISAASLFCSAPFGSLGAIIMPALIRAVPDANKTLSSISEIFGGAEVSVDAIIEEYADMLGLPLTFSGLGVDKNNFLKQLAPASKRAAAFPAAQKLFPEDTQNHIEEVLRAAFGGK